MRRSRRRKKHDGLTGEQGFFLLEGWCLGPVPEGFETREAAEEAWKLYGAELSKWEVSDFDGWDTAREPGAGPVWGYYEFEASDAEREAAGLGPRGRPWIEAAQRAKPPEPPRWMKESQKK